MFQTIGSRGFATSTNQRVPCQLSWTSVTLPVWSSKHHRAATLYSTAIQHMHRPPGRQTGRQVDSNSCLCPSAASSAELSAEPSTLTCRQCIAHCSCSEGCAPAAAQTAHSCPLSVQEKGKGLWSIATALLSLKFQHLLSRCSPHDRCCCCIAPPLPPPRGRAAVLLLPRLAASCRGAAQGEGLGNAFLSHISAVDGIYHVCRAFEDVDVTHVEDRVDPVSDLDIIHSELRLKDIERLSGEWQAGHNCWWGSVNGASALWPRCGCGGGCECVCVCVRVCVCVCG